jgi:hypothetical protein
MELSIVKVKDAGAPWFAAAAKMPVPQAWRRCAVAFLAAFFGGLGSLYAFVLLVDPYDTGRFPTPMPTGVFAGQGRFETGQRTGSASRGRDPRFNAAIFGNSRAQLFDRIEFRPAHHAGLRPQGADDVDALFPAPPSGRRSNGVWHGRTLVRP